MDNKKMYSVCVCVTLYADFSNVENYDIKRRSDENIVLFKALHQYILAFSKDIDNIIDIPKQNKDNDYFLSTVGAGIQHV